MVDLYLLDKAFREYAGNKEMRTGQSLMNALGDVDMELYRKISETSADCFYSDKSIPAFWEAVTKEV